MPDPENIFREFDAAWAGQSLGGWRATGPVLQSIPSRGQAIAGRQGRSVLWPSFPTAASGFRQGLPDDRVIFIRGQNLYRHKAFTPRFGGMCPVDSVQPVSHHSHDTFQLRTTRTMTLSDTAWRQLISELHASGHKVALAITGGGSGAVAELLRVPGGSRLLIEAQIPYDSQALAAFLGSEPAQASSSETAIAMAQSARSRAARFVPTGTDLVGLGATAALVSDRPRKGEHRFHIAFANSAGIAHCSGVLAKGRRDRAAEEDLVSRAIVLFLASACGIAAPSPRSLLDVDEYFEETPPAPVDPIDRLVAGEIDRVTVQPDGQMVLSAPPPSIVLPGSFNPVHDGHTLLARAAEELKRQPVAFEISVTNVDKPPLSSETVKQRLAQFARKSPVELTRAPTFLEKARLFPGTTFVIGADTAERLFAPKYYGDDEARMHAALEEISNSGCSFLVAARLDPKTGRLRSLSNIPVPPRYTDLFTEIAEHRFRLDTSSSEIRAQGRSAGDG